MCLWVERLCMGTRMRIPLPLSRREPADCPFDPHSPMTKATVRAESPPPDLCCCLVLTQFSQASLPGPPSRLLLTRLTHGGAAAVFPVLDEGTGSRMQ